MELLEKFSNEDHDLIVVNFLIYMIKSQCIRVDNPKEISYSVYNLASLRDGKAENEL